MGNLVEITEISSIDYYFNSINPITYTERAIPLESFDFNNVPGNIIYFRICFDLEKASNNKRYSMWIYNGRSISLERLKEIYNEVKASKEEVSAMLLGALKEQNYLTNPFDKEIAILKTTDGKLSKLIEAIGKTIKNMEELGIRRACQINNINFYPMDEECITLTDCIEIQRNKKIIPEFKNILNSQTAMKASILSLITNFKGQTHEYFKHSGEDNSWDFSWLDTASKEEVYNLFMSCIQLVCGLKQQFDGEHFLRKQMVELFNIIVPKKDSDDSEPKDLEKGRLLQYINPEDNL